MNSPYMMQGGAPSFGPPPGLAQILAQRDQELQSNSKGIGDTLGKFGAGAVGAMQGSSSPGTFGAGTSAAMGGVKGFMQNFAAAGNGGGGGSSFADMVNPRGGGSGGGAGGGSGGAPGGMSVNQLKLASKTADAFRAQMASQTPSTDDEDPKVLGHTDDEWDTLGAADKWSAVQGYVQGQVQNEVGARLQDYAAQAQERTAQAKAGQDAGTFLKAYAGDLPKGVEDNAQNRLKQGLGGLPPGADVNRALPQALNSLAKFAQIGAAATKGWKLDPTDTVPGPDGSVGVPQSPNSLQWLNKPTPSPKLSARTVPEMDEMGKPTGNMQVEYSGDPDAVNSYVEKFNKSKSAATSAAALPKGSGASLTPDVAQKFLQAAGGDKAKARELATQSGWKF